jgi:hypothetical protein
MTEETKTLDIGGVVLPQSAQVVAGQVRQGRGRLGRRSGRSTAGKYGNWSGLGWPGRDAGRRDLHG